MPCALYELQVPIPVYETIAQRIAQMQHSADAYHYNCLGVLLCKLDFAFQRQYHYFCSQFVADLLQQSGAIEFEKAASLIQPGDFLRLPQLSNCIIKDSWGSCPGNISYAAIIWTAASNSSPFLLFHTKQILFCNAVSSEDCSLPALPPR